MGIFINQIDQPKIKLDSIYITYSGLTILLPRNVFPVP